MLRLLALACCLLVAACATPGSQGPGAAPGAEAAAPGPKAAPQPLPRAAPAVPWVHHPPWDPDDDDAGPPLPRTLSFRPLDPGDWQGLAGLFVHLARHSKATYVVAPEPHLPPGAADALLGVPVTWPEGARPFAEVIEAGGTPTVVDRRPGPAADADMVAAELATRDGAYAAALRLYRQVTRVSPGLAKAWTFRAEDAAALGHLDEANEAVVRALALAPVDPMAHAVEAELALAAGHRRRARVALATALALYPGFPAAVALVAAVTGEPFTWRPLSPPARVARQGQRRILVQADVRRTSAWLAWALCEAVGRYDPDPRLLPFGGRGETLRREVVCGLTLADAATGPGSAAGTPFADPRVARIARVARAGHLGDLIVYDLVGTRSPGLLLGLDPATRRRLVDYVARFVLPGGDDGRRLTAAAGR